MSLLKIILDNAKKIKSIERHLCCIDPNGSGCPPISASVGNTIICNTDGIYSAGGVGAITGAVNGVSLSGTNVVLGQNVSQVGNPAILTSNREIPMGGFTISNTDTLGNSNVYGAGTLVTTRVAGGTSIRIDDFVTTNTSANCLVAASFVTFGSFSNYTAGGGMFSTRVFNTLSSGITLTTTQTNRQSSFFGSLNLENDIGANNNTITIAGGYPVSVYMAKVDLCPIAIPQIKTVNGSIAGYSTYLDGRFNTGGSTLQSYTDFDAGRGDGSVITALTITDRYGFRVANLNIATITTTNRWGFYQEGTTDKNYFAGFSAFGIATPTARVHIGAGTATAGTAPLKLTAGTNLTTPEDGTFEFDGTNLYFTTGGTRKTVTLV